MQRNILVRVMALALAVSFLCGCTAWQGVEELLRAPQLSVDTKEVQSALNSHLGETVQFKYPNQGDFLTPYFFGDWDGDDQIDAAVLYQASSSANVQLALLQRNEEGSWKVQSTVEGLSATVDSVRLATIQNNGGEQILVGYSTAGDTYLAVYNLKDGSLETVLQQPYTQYLVEDITGDEVEDLIVLADDSAGKTQVQVLIGANDGFTRLPAIGLSDEYFSGYASLAAGAGARDGQFLVLDGWTGAGGQDLASAVFRYDSTNHRMEMTKLDGTDNLYRDSLRYAPCLISRDLDGDGIVEIPTQKEDTGLLSQTQGKRYSFVHWMDFTSTSSVKSFGILDEAYNIYIQLPQEWEGDLMLKDGANDTLEVCNLAGDRVLMRLRITDEPSMSSWYTIGLVASRQIQAQIASDVTELTVADLRSGIHFL